MSEAKAPSPVKVSKRPSALQSWHPLESLRQQIDRLVEDFDKSFRQLSSAGASFEDTPTWWRDFSSSTIPNVDIVQKNDAYEITADLPGMDEKDVEVKLANGGLMIKGEKKEEKDETEKNYYVHERHFGAFERYFPVPDDVDTGKIDAVFKKGVLVVKLPRRPEAQKPETKIEVRAG
ncbi:MAG: Hsp20/alpha crystallin family protein [Parvibaculum sp.]|nr:Hsp20/alpha crystallin family protein [Parvibaculum sp.]